MINFYVGMIQRGKLTLDDVPYLWHDKVEKKLKELGLIETDSE